MKLLIAEKPSMAKKYQGALSDTGTVITSSVGHIEELQSLEHYLTDAISPDATDEKQKISWTQLLSHLPFVPEQFELTITNREQFKKIADLLPKASEIILACDPDREGELIHRNILKIAQKKGFIKTDNITRVWLHSETSKEIRKAFDKRKSYLEYDGYYQAAHTRSVIDWLIGIQFTVLYTVKYGGGGLISIGRVQTWLLSEIIKRALQFKKFEPQLYWTFSLQTPEGVTFSLIDSETEKIRRFFEKSEAQKALSCLKGKTLTVSYIEKKPFTEYAPSLYDLNALQKDASKKFGFSPDNTLKIAQKLYETHHLISYPRSDCNVLSPEEAKEIPNAVALVERFDEFKPLVSRVKQLNSSLTLHKKFVGDLKGHYAIIPVLSYDQDSIPSLSDAESKLFRLIVHRLLSALMPPAKGENTVVLADSNTDYPFQARFKNYTDLGFKNLSVSVENENDDENSDDGAEDQAIVVNYQSGDTVSGKLQNKQNTTKPEPLFKDTSIISLMEKAHLQVKEKRLREALKNASGIGTVTTRSSFIPLLVKRGFIEQNKKEEYVPTKTGVQLYKILPEELKAPDFSAQLEYDLSLMIDKKGRPFDELLKETSDYLTTVFNKVTAAENISLNTDKNKSEPLGKCPLCGSQVFEVGKVFKCEKNTGKDEGCAFVAFKSFSGGAITATDMKSLLSGKKTRKKKFHSRKKDKDFEAKLELKNGKVGFSFE